jgi:hypothetical protein
MHRIEEFKRKAWEEYRSNDSSSLKPKDKLLALKLAKECDESKFVLFKDGSSVISLKTLEVRMNKIEPHRLVNK